MTCTVCMMGLPHIVNDIFRLAYLAVIVPAHSVFFGIISHSVTNKIPAV